MHLIGILLIFLTISEVFTYRIVKRQSDDARTQKSISGFEDDVDGKLSEMRDLGRQPGRKPPVRPPVRRRRPRIRVPPNSRSRFSNRKDLKFIGARSSNEKNTTPRPPSPTTEKITQKVTKLPPATNLSKSLSVNEAPKSISKEEIQVMNSSAMIGNSPEFKGEIEVDEESNGAKKSALIIGGVISAIAICIFLLVMVAVMMMNRTEISRNKGSIKKMVEKERAQKRRIPRMKSVREVRDNIFSSIRKVRKNRPPRR